MDSLWNNNLYAVFIFLEIISLNRIGIIYAINMAYIVPYIAITLYNFKYIVA